MKAMSAVLAFAASTELRQALKEWDGYGIDVSHGRTLSVVLGSETFELECERGKFVDGARPFLEWIQTVRQNHFRRPKMDAWCLDAGAVDG